MQEWDALFGNRVFKLSGWKQDEDFGTDGTRQEDLNEVIGLAILKTGTRMSQGPSLVYDRGLDFQIHDNCPILLTSSENREGGGGGQVYGRRNVRCSPTSA